MIEYAIVILLALVGFFFVDNKHAQRNKGIWIALIWLVLTLLIGLRFQVGGDTINYMGDYNWRNGLLEWEFDLTDKYQPGYTFLCSIAKSFSSEFYVFQLIHAATVNSQYTVVYLY